MQEILSLCPQHAATPEQIAAGVVELNADDAKAVLELGRFVSAPNFIDIAKRAAAIAAIAKTYGASRAMIGGAPYLMGPLEGALSHVDIAPVYSFSERVSVEMLDENGKPTGGKNSVFRHVAFIEAT